MITSDTRINKIVSPINNRIEELRIELYNNEDKENFRGHAKRGWSSPRIFFIFLGSYSV